MCLIVFALDSHPVYQLIFLANRDEFYDRPSAAAHFWEEAPRLLAGRDLQAGGTWMGITTAGRVAAVTNYRDPGFARVNARSRGELVVDFLLDEQAPAQYLKSVAGRGRRYNGFNLLAGTPGELHWYSNRSERPPQRVTPGIHGLSNHLLDTPWPKVARSKNALTRLAARGEEISQTDLFAILEDRSRPPDSDLPDTGVGLAWERVLSPAFIVSPDYGTRSSMVLLVDREGTATFVEKTFDHQGSPSVIQHQFQISSP